MIQSCGLCKAPLQIQAVSKPLGIRANCYEDCHLECPKCRIALSNSSTRPTFIRKVWQEGLWRPETQTRLIQIIDHSLNIKSRRKKKTRLANERSEDLLTWNVFSWLEETRCLGRFLKSVGLASPIDEPLIFYWGANDLYSLVIGGRPFKDFLVNYLGERWDRLSEPDLMLWSPEEVTLVEAKLGSRNDVAKKNFDRTRFDKYFRSAPGFFTDEAQTRKGGFYELARYWAIGGALTRLPFQDAPKRFSVLNLVREGKEEQSEKALSKLFCGGTFRRATWENCMGQVAPPELLNHLKKVTLYFEPAFPRF